MELFEKSRPGTFDGILMDVMMPVMDGLTATKTIRALPRPDAATIPIIAMTANAFQEDAQKCYDAGMNAHIGKPLEMDKVVTVISQFCGCKEDTKKHGRSWPEKERIKHEKSDSGCFLWEPPIRMH